MTEAAEREAARVAKLPDSGDNRMVGVFSPSSVRIERVRLAVQYGHPEDAPALAEGMRLSKDTPPSWRTWLLLDVARAHTDIRDAAEAVKTLESLRRVAPTWMRHHTPAVAIVRDLWALPNHPPGLRPLAEFLGGRRTAWRKWDVAPLSAFPASRLQEHDSRLLSVPAGPRERCDPQTSAGDPGRLSRAEGESGPFTLAK